MTAMRNALDVPPGWEGPPDGVPCCMGSACNGWHACTCWEPIYLPAEQAYPLPRQVPAVMPSMCADCAYRPGSPERRGSPDAMVDSEKLDDLAISRSPFWCHDGLRYVAALRHASTGELWHAESAEDGRAVAHYDPPIIDGRPYRADGTIGALCAGWDARRRAWAAAPADRNLPPLAEAGTR